MRKITIRRFAVCFATFEALTFLAGYGLDIMALQGLFWLSLLIGPLMILPWIVQANTRETDKEFESPVAWTALALIGFLAFVVLVAVGIYAMIQGSVGGSILLLSASLLVIASSMRMIRSARERREDWRRMRAAQRMLCPVCGVRVRDSTGICGSCGAVVFWVPSWTAEE